MRVLFNTLLRSNFRCGRMLCSRAPMLRGCICRTLFAVPSVC